MQTYTNLGDQPRKDRPDKLAIIDLSRNEPRHYTYQQLNDMADAVARGLSKYPLLNESKIAIVGLNTIEFLATYFGILRAGHTVVLINCKWTRQQVSEIIKKNNVEIIFCDQKLINLCPEGVKSIVFESEFNTFLNYGEFKSFEVQESTSTLCMFTSGSTGVSKSILLTHKNRTWLINNKTQITSTDYSVSALKQVIASPIYHMSALTKTETTLAQGITIVLLPEFEPISYLHAIDKYKAHFLLLVPTMVEMLLRQKDLLKSLDLSSVWAIYLASAPSSIQLIDEAEKYFTGAIDRVFCSYGLTEVGAGLFSGVHPQGINRPKGSVGYPSLGIEFRIVDAILQVKSPSLMKELDLIQDDDKKKLTPDGFYITNDLFRVDEQGFYYFLGRADDMFVCGGHNIFASAVEKRMELHPEILMSRVIGLPDDIKGMKPYAFVILKDASQLSENEIVNYCLEQGPAFEHPRRVWRLKNWPLTVTGKIDKAQLIKLADILIKQQPNVNEFVLEFSKK